MSKPKFISIEWSMFRISSITHIGIYNEMSNGFKHYLKVSMANRDINKIYFKNREAAVAAYNEVEKFIKPIIMH